MRKSTDYYLKNLQVGDTIITKSFTYEQDGNIKNGNEPIEWKVEKVQIIYTMYGTYMDGRNKEIAEIRCEKGDLFSFTEDRDTVAKYLKKGSITNKIDFVS